MVRFSLDHKSIRHYCAFFNHHNSIFYSIKRMVCIFKMCSAIDPNIIAYAAIFINDRIADITTFADTYFW